MKQKTRLPAEKRRELIIEAALEVFSENGYNGSTIKMIADRAGINEGLIYKHFKSKEELYTAILDMKGADKFDEDKFCAAMEKGDDKEVFMHFARLYLNVMQSNDKLVKLITFGQLTSPDLANPKIFKLHFDSGDESPVSVLAEYIRKKVEEGKFIKKRPKLVARVFVGMVHWYGLRRLIAKSRQWNVYDEEEVLDTMITLFLGGLVSRQNHGKEGGGKSGF